MRLDLGGGLAPAPGHINIDIIKGADTIWDLNKGLPSFVRYQGKTINIKGKSTPKIEGIRCHQVIEHLDNIIRLMNDCYKVMTVGALMEISTPMAGTSQFWQDPTHKKGYVPESFDYFIENSPYHKEQKEYGITARFKCLGALVEDNWNLNVTLQK